MRSHSVSCFPVQVAPDSTVLQLKNRVRAECECPQHMCCAVCDSSLSLSSAAALPREAAVQSQPGQE